MVAPGKNEEQTTFYQHSLQHAPPQSYTILNDYNEDPEQPRILETALTGK